VSQGLLNSVYLIGAFVCESEALRAQESTLLSRAVEHTRSDDSDPSLVHRLQAEVLLTYYFLCNGKFLEAMHRLNKCMSLCIGSGLHRQESSLASYPLPPPQDTIELGERLDAFWTVLWLNKAWGVALNWPSTNASLLENEVDLPWPLNGSEYATVSSSFPCLHRQKPS
jgi:hypothetical protein